MLVLWERVGLRTDEMSVGTRSEKTGAGSCLGTRNTYNRITGKARWSTHEGTSGLSEIALLKNASVYHITISSKGGKTVKSQVSLQCHSEKALCPSSSTSVC